MTTRSSSSLPVMVPADRFARSQLPKVNVEQLIAKATELYSGDLQELQVKTKQLSPIC